MKAIALILLSTAAAFSAAPPLPPPIPPSPPKVSTVEPFRSPRDAATVRYTPMAKFVPASVPLSGEPPLPMGWHYVNTPGEPWAHEFYANAFQPANHILVFEWGQDLETWDGLAYWGPSSQDRWILAIVPSNHPYDFVRATATPATPVILAERRVRSYKAKVAPADMRTAGHPDGWVSTKVRGVRSFVTVAPVPKRK